MTISSEEKLLKGRPLALVIQEQIRQEIEDAVRNAQTPPRMLAIQAAEDASADWYIGQQEKLAGKLGIEFAGWVRPADIDGQDALIRKVEQAGQDRSIHGIFLAMPLPPGFNADEVLLRLDPGKDIEGIHPASLGMIVLRRARLIPPTAFAAFRLIEACGLELRGKKAVIVGQSAIVGRPLQLLLGERRVTTIVCNTGTSEADMRRFIEMSDIVVACAGSPGMIRGEWVQEGQVVIDVGTTEVNGELKGDVDFDGAVVRAARITPVPGGVGPLTVTMLMQNLMTAWRAQSGSKLV